MIVFFSKKVGCDSNTLISYNMQLNACQKVSGHVICGLCIERNQGVVSSYVVTFASRLVLYP